MVTPKSHHRKQSRELRGEVALNPPGRPLGWLTPLSARERDIISNAAKVEPAVSKAAPAAPGSGPKVTETADAPKSNGTVG